MRLPIGFRRILVTPIFIHSICGGCIWLINLGLKVLAEKYYGAPINETGNLALFITLTTSQFVLLISAILFVIKDLFKHRYIENLKSIYFTRIIVYFFLTTLPIIISVCIHKMLLSYIISILGGILIFPTIKEYGTSLDTNNYYRSYDYWLSQQRYEHNYYQRNPYRDQRREWDNNKLDHSILILLIGIIIGYIFSTSL